MATEEEALSLANFEVQRLKWNDDGFQGNRIARDKLRAEKAARDDQQRQQKQDADKLCRQGLVVKTGL